MILKGKKVILRKNRVTDAKRYLEWLADPEINQYILTTAKDLTLEKEKEYIRKSNKDKTKAKFAICTKMNQHIGVVSLDKVDQKNKSGSLGIFIGDKKYHNQGYGTESLEVILNYGFKTLKLNRIRLGVFENNKKAQKVYQKIGFKKEGVEREKVFKNNRFINSILMSILKSEWEEKHGKK